MEPLVCFYVKSEENYVLLAHFSDKSWLYWAVHEYFGSAAFKHYQKLTKIGLDGLYSSLDRVRIRMIQQCNAAFCEVTQLTTDPEAADAWEVDALWDEVDCCDMDVEILGIALSFLATLQIMRESLEETEQDGSPLYCKLIKNSKK